MTINKIMEKGIRILVKNKVKMVREEWIDEAVTCE
jgi:hypothetical protein